MEIENVFLIVVLAIAAIQGVIYGFILFKSVANNKMANRILAVMLLLLSYRLIVQIMRLFGLGYYDTWYYFMIDLSWVHGALIYFYTRARTSLGFRFQKRDLWHFLPLGLQVAISIFVRLQNLYWDGTRESLSWLGYHAYAIWMNNSTIYVVASILILIYVVKSKKLIAAANEKYHIPNAQLGWIKRIIHAFLVYFSVVLLILVADMLVFTSYNYGDYFYFTRFYYYPFFIGMGVLTYWIGMEGFSRRHDPTLTEKAVIDQDELVKLQAIAEKVRTVMERDRLYRDQELSLQMLADVVAVKPYLVSKSLSEVLDKRFNDFVNEYRVAEVQRLLRNPQNSKYTLLSLAMDVGFNSKSSFNRAIKKHLGVMPSELRFDEAEFRDEI
ncbi:MAG: hypothetical protein Tsb004_28260 [Allomuricauda sp.]